jgi:1-phosphatidylinositol-4-phosphate 5-kinase
MAAVAVTNASSVSKIPTGITRHKSERERKIGHRRVGVGGEITYKKVCSLGLILKSISF